jgi:hypothetical protein
MGKVAKLERIFYFANNSSISIFVNFKCLKYNSLSFSIDTKVDIIETSVNFKLRLIHSVSTMTSPILCLFEAQSLQIKVVFHSF